MLLADAPRPRLPDDDALIIGAMCIGSLECAALIVFALTDNISALCR